jgi:hypothetical protein
LPRQEVADFLEGLDPALSSRFLEFLIEERNEISQSFHNRLAELYLSMTLSAKKRGDEGEHENVQFALALTIANRSPKGCLWQAHQVYRQHSVLSHRQTVWHDII